MNILIDADGCPVVDLTLQIAKRFGISVIILCHALQVGCARCGCYHLPQP